MDDQKIAEKGKFANLKIFFANGLIHSDRLLQLRRTLRVEVSLRRLTVHI
jgi:hypothetical protein